MAGNILKVTGEARRPALVDLERVAKMLRQGRLFTDSEPVIHEHEDGKVEAFFTLCRPAGA